MTSNEKLLAMFEKAYGLISGKCYLEILTNDDGEAVAVAVMKDDNICWSKSKVDIVFDYLTKEWE